MTARRRGRAVPALPPVTVPAEAPKPEEDFTYQIKSGPVDKHGYRTDIDLDRGNVRELLVRIFREGTDVMGRIGGPEAEPIVRPEHRPRIWAPALLQLLKVMWWHMGMNPIDWHHPKFHALDVMTREILAGMIAGGVMVELPDMYARDYPHGPSGYAPGPAFGAEALWASGVLPENLDPARPAAHERDFWRCILRGDMAFVWGAGRPLVVRRVLGPAPRPTAKIPGSLGETLDERINDELDEAQARWLTLGALIAQVADGDGFLEPGEDLTWPRDGVRLRILERLATGSLMRIGDEEDDTDQIRRVTPADIEARRGLHTRAAPPPPPVDPTVIHLYNGWPPSDARVAQRPAPAPQGPLEASDAGRTS